MRNGRRLALPCLIMSVATAAHAFPAPAGSGELGGGRVRALRSEEPGWPQWRGPLRNGVSSEGGLRDRWPDGGPPTVWTAEGLGRGYSSPVISTERIFITGDVGDVLRIFALDRQGKLLWTAENGRSWKHPYPGARASCALSEGRLYHMNAHGRVACIDPETGREIWSVDVLERFGGRTTRWGLSECLLIDRSLVIVTAGGREATMAALDKRTGATVWTTPPVSLDRAGTPPSEPAGDDEPDQASYASPVLVEFGGRRLIVGCSARHLLVVDAETGELQWKRPFLTRFQVLGLTPEVVSDGVFMTAPDGPGGKLYRFVEGGRRVGVEEAWTADIDTCHGGVVHVDGLLVGSWYRRFNGWGAVDARTGKTLCRTRDLVMGSAVHADGLFYCLAQDGTMALVDAGRERFHIESRFRFAQARRNDAWAHPVILDGRLYLRYHERLECRDIRERR